MRLAAGLRPDLLGRLSAPQTPIAAIGRGVLLLRGREVTAEGRGKEEGMGEKGRARFASSLFNFWLRV